MLTQLITGSLTLMSLAAVAVVIVAGAVITMLKGHATLTLPHLAAGIISPPVAIVGAVGTVIALVVDPTILAAAIVTVLVALTASIMTILTKLAENKRSTEAATLELAKISRSVDGVASRQVDKVANLEKENAELRVQLASAEKRAEMLAVTTAMTGSQRPAPSVAVDLPASGETLEQVERNTKDTADNTARTEAKVEDLKDRP